MATNDPKGSFVRWQAITIAQLTYAVNLILAFSVATLGFLLSLVPGGAFTPFDGCSARAVTDHTMTMRSSAAWNRRNVRTEA